jgi:hypothetical protein
MAPIKLAQGDNGDLAPMKQTNAQGFLNLTESSHPVTHHIEEKPYPMSNKPSRRRQLKFASPTVLHGSLYYAPMLDMPSSCKG